LPSRNRRQGGPALRGSFHVKTPTSRTHDLPTSNTTSSKAHTQTSYTVQARLTKLNPQPHPHPHHGKLPSQDPDGLPPRARQNDRPLPPPPHHDRRRRLRRPPNLKKVLRSNSLRKALPVRLKRPSVSNLRPISKFSS
jgi:hypothetical protein